MCRTRVSGTGTAWRIEAAEARRTAADVGAQGGKRAAWQNGQVASLCFGAGSDSRGEEMLGPGADEGGGWSGIRLVAPSRPGMAVNNSRRRRPGRIR